MTVEEFKLGELAASRQRCEEEIATLDYQIERVLLSPGPTQERHLNRLDELCRKQDGKRNTLTLLNRQISELVAEMEKFRKS